MALTRVSMGSVLDCGVTHTALWRCPICLSCSAHAVTYYVPPQGPAIPVIETPECCGAKGAVLDTRRLVEYRLAPEQNLMAVMGD